MKKAAIITLVCINVLLVGLVIAHSMPRADAQTYRGGNHYLMMTGELEPDYDAIYVLDLTSRRLAAWRFDRGDKRLVPYRGRDLARDFRQGR